MKLQHAALVPFAFVVIAACGGSTASIGPDSDGGCIEAQPTAGAACSPGQTICSKGDACCLGFWECDASDHIWRHEFPGCGCFIGTDAGPKDSGKDAARVDAGPVVCGGTTCGTNDFCFEEGGGAQPPEGGSNLSFTCTALPAACVDDPTCACLKAQGATHGCGCNDNDAGPQVACLYP